jgi:2'-5' RNA ligase
MRTFIAVELEPAIKAALTSFLSRLKKAAPSRISWVRPEGMHLTLKFLGEIDAGRAGKVMKVMDAAAAATRPFLLRIRGTGCFPSSRFPRVLWVGTAPSDDLDSLAARLESGLAAIGFEGESRPFHPHLTLGRVRSGPGAVRGAVTELELQANAEFGAMTAAKITMFESLLRPWGAEYHVLKESAFP